MVIRGEGGQGAPGMAASGNLAIAPPTKQQGTSILAVLTGGDVR